MARKWNALAEPPKDASPEAHIRWLRDDIADFWRDQTGNEDADVSALKKREQNRIFRAWYKAREAAELEESKKRGAEWYKIVKRFQRTRTIVIKPKKVKSRRRSKPKRAP
jgi:hypothetical protein